jgi:hypothetical protein
MDKDNLINTISTFQVPSIPLYTNTSTFLSGNLYDCDFTGDDSYDLYQSNLKSLPIDWHYRSKPISYQANLDGYRAPEWNSIDWSNSIVMFGCSETLGIGLSLDETISSQLSDMLSRPVVNMGVGGSSMLFALHNNILLLDNFTTPWAVVNNWSSSDRIHSYDFDVIHHYTPWGDLNNLLLNWNEGPNAQVQAMFISKLAKGLWKDRCRYYECSVFPHTAKSLNCNFFNHDDYARDCLHIGKTTAFNIACDIKKSFFSS